MKKLNDKYYIDSDAHCLILYEKKIYTNGKKKGEEYYDVIGYYGKLSHIYKAIIEREIRCDLELLSNIEKIVKLIDEIKE